MMEGLQKALAEHLTEERIAAAVRSLDQLDLLKPEVPPEQLRSDLIVDPGCWWGDLHLDWMEGVGFKIWSTIWNSPDHQGWSNQELTAVRAGVNMAMLVLFRMVQVETGRAWPPEWNDPEGSEEPLEWRQTPLPLTLDLPPADPPS